MIRRPWRACAVIGIKIAFFKLRKTPSNVSNSLIMAASAIPVQPVSGTLACLYICLASVCIFTCAARPCDNSQQTTPVPNLCHEGYTVRWQVRSACKPLFALCSPHLNYTFVWIPRAFTEHSLAPGGSKKKRKKDCLLGYLLFEAPAFTPWYASRYIRARIVFGLS